jgi:YD repeat-containing protein
MARLISVPDAPPAGGSVSKTFSLSGLALTELSDDGFSISYRYDAAGRVVAVSSDGSDLWTADGADDLDGAGRIEHERYGNATTQTYEYDALGLVSHLKVTQPSAASLYDVTVVRNSYGAPKIVTDLDGRGLDQSATYGYDAAGRLTAATLGALGPQQFAFTYAYDVLQNLTSRTVSGPAEIGVLTGTYRYGERGYGPRQLTSVVP